MVEYRAVSAENWQDLAHFFESNGNPNYCWCMRWRLRSGDFGKLKSADRRQRLHRSVHANTPVGVAAYDGEQVIGWCSIAPRTTFEGLERSRVLKRIDEQPVWSVTCFFIDRNFRKQGVTRGLLQAAIDYATANGATLVEGYPVPPDQSYRFMGSHELFQAVGFDEVAIAKNGRSIVRIEMTDQS